MQIAESFHYCLYACAVPDYFRVVDFSKEESDVAPCRFFGIHALGAVERPDDFIFQDYREMHPEGHRILPYVRAVCFLSNRPAFAELPDRTLDMTWYALYIDH